MPTYNYYCNRCDTHFSYFQKMSELPFSSCENCGGEVQRLITGGTGLIFKGSGFYLTDYKNNKKSKDDSPVSTKEKNENMNKGEKTKIENTNSKDISIKKKEKRVDE